MNAHEKDQKITLGMLEVIALECTVAQRALASRLGIANVNLKRCGLKGRVYVPDIFSIETQ